MAEYKRTATVRELDALRDDIATTLATSGDFAPSLILVWLQKIRAHVEADELERQRLQAEIMLRAQSGGERLFTEETAVQVLDLKPNWRLAPQSAREAAMRMKPHPVCGERFDDDTAYCKRDAGHRGEHCPRLGCGVDHG